METNNERWFMNTLEIARQVTLKKILFATDFSFSSNAALPYAIAIAQLGDAKLYAAHIQSSDSYLFATPESWPALINGAQQRQIDAIGLEERLRESPHKVMSSVGDISDVLFRLVRDNEIDLLVVGTHGRSGVPKLLMGSVAEKIFRLASCPVLTVGPHASREQKGAPSFHRILFATDFSDESLAAASYAVAIAREHQAHLYFLHVLGQPGATTIDLESNSNFVIARMQDLVPPGSDLWFRANYSVAFGSPEEQILRFADEHVADLILLGVRAPHGAMNKLTHLAHSKARQIVARATCPVLTVRG
jgi:nucleotide-binding universal stress UspA family protein